MEVLDAIIYAIMAGWVFWLVFFYGIIFPYAVFKYLNKLED